MTYDDFLDAKKVTAASQGIEPGPINPILFDFQRDIVRWALRRGRASIFADCGMGKTFMQLEWARQIPGPVLILAPLAVSSQTVEEGRKLGLTVTPCRDQSHCNPGGINIANYEMLDHFDPSFFKGVVLDESSIIKHFEGKFRNLILQQFSATPFRLACTATPAPNDHMELGNHAEFMGVMTRTEMLSCFFVHDGGETAKWRLKGHAETEFWKWVCSWAVMIRKPSDLGYNDRAFVLKQLHLAQLTVESKDTGEFLIPMEALTIQERLGARRASINERVAACSELVNRDEDKWVIWCNLNDESAALRAAINDSVEITGSEPHDQKRQKLIDFSAGKIRVLVTKPSIAGHGMNWQHCHKMAFVGLSDSWEQYYQAVRRCWRFGQKKNVEVTIITSSSEGAVLTNITRKDREAARMAREMVKHMHSINEENIKGVQRNEQVYLKDSVSGENFVMHLGDCIEVSKDVGTESIDFSIFSPPFASLYTYSDSERDMGNSRSYDEFFTHMGFLIEQLMRVTKQGRLVSFHCMNLPTSKSHHGYIGLIDFRGHLIRAFTAAGFIFHSEVCIWKDPVVSMQRTKALGLLHKQMVKDSCMSRQGVPDYLVTMRKPGMNEGPVCGELDKWAGDDSFQSNGRMSIDLWQRYASPVWMDIKPGNTLQRESAREEKDERHICPLQLDVIERALMLWSNPGDLIFSPFAGIGSEGFVALQMERQFLGIELKRSYWTQAVENLRAVDVEKQPELFNVVA